MGYNRVRLCECREKAQTQKENERLFSSSQITPAFKQKTFDNFLVQGKAPLIHFAYRCAKFYAEKFSTIKDSENNWLVFLGQPGSGKTHLAMATANHLIFEEGIPCLYFQHVEGINEMKDNIRGEAGIKAQLQKMKQIDVLVWDDLFKTLRQFDKEVAFEVLNYRYLNLLPTIITSEKTPKELIEIDPATGSRIIERAALRLVSLEGKELNHRLNGER